MCPELTVAHPYDDSVRRWGPLWAMGAAVVVLAAIAFVLIQPTVGGSHVAQGATTSTSTTTASPTTRVTTRAVTTTSTTAIVPVPPTQTTVAPATSVPTTLAPPTLVPTAVGALPQTTTLPSAQDPAFVAKMAAVVQSIRTGNCETSLFGFFPLAAFLQVKAEYGAASDWQYRLVGHYCGDIAVLHSDYASVASSMTFVSVSVPSWGVQWMAPGSEYNKGPYWHALGTQLTFAAGGVTHSVPIMMLDSWRGEWYLVHLSSFT